MENKAVFISCTEEIEINKKTAPRFWLLYQEAVLLSLKEQGVLDEIQFQFCINALAKQSGNDF